MVAPVFGSVGTYLQVSVSTASVAVPASVASGDLIVVVMFINGATSLTTPASGFVDAPNSPVVNTSGNAHRVHVLWKRATGADSGTYDFVLSASDFMSAAALRYTGVVGSGSPWDVTTSANSGDATSSQTPAVSVTTTGDNRMLVFAGSNWSGGGWTPPTGFNERVDSGFAVVTADDLVQAVAGSSGTVQATSVGNNRTVAWLGALLPVPPTIYTKSGGAVSAGAGVGSKTLQQPTGYTKSGGAVSPGSGSGGKVLVQPASYVKSGGAVTAGAGSGASALVHPAGYTKSGGAVGVGAGSGVRAVAEPAVYIKSGGAFAVAVGGQAPFNIPPPTVDWPPLFAGPVLAPLVSVSVPVLAPLVLFTELELAPLVLVSGPVLAASPGSTERPLLSRRGLARRSTAQPADAFVIEKFRALRDRRRAAKSRGISGAARECEPDPG